MIETLSKIKKISMDLTIENGVAPTKEEIAYDILKEYNQLDDINVPKKTFEASDYNSRYEVTEDLGATKLQLNIIGILSETGSVESVIDANGFGLFVADKPNGAQNCIYTVARNARH